MELQRAVLERWLVTDIAESSLPVLPSDQFTTLTNMALQVNWVHDVSTSAYRQLQLLRGQDISDSEVEVGTPAAKRAKVGVAQVHVTMAVWSHDMRLLLLWPGALGETFPDAPGGDDGRALGCECN